LARCYQAVGPAASRLELPRVVRLELSPRCCEKPAPRRISKIHYRGDKEERQYNVLPVVRAVRWLPGQVAETLTVSRFSAVSEPVFLVSAGTTL